MRERAAAILGTVCVFVVSYCAQAENASGPNSTTPVGTIAADAVTASAELVRHENEFSSARLEPARMGQNRGVAVIFEGTHDLHYYAKAETAPAIGSELKVEAQSDDFGFAEAVFPKWDIFSYPVGNKVEVVEVYAGQFTVFLPITTIKAPTKTTVIDKGDVQVRISGIACTSMICLPPFEKSLRTTIDLTQSDTWKQISLQTPGDTPAKAIKGPAYPVLFALALAFTAGLALNIMPCVWPVLPLIVMRIVQQAKQSRRQSITMGLAFCLGILLFFACLAGSNIILKVFYETALQWGDQFRSPVLLIAMALLMIVMALFMFGLFTISVPSSIAGKLGSGKGYPGAVAMGFLAAILSTPCSFGILTVAFVWIQGQSLALGTFAIIIMGLGMAMPYAILTSMPAVLKHLPRAGRWMELFKQTLGFVLLLIAVKLLKGVPEGNKINVLYFAVVLSFCIWMWAGWVGYGTKLSRKLVVRIIAVILAVLAFQLFFAPELIDWQKYDADLIENAKSRQRPVLIKFTAGWCTNCEVVDRVVYKRKDIARLIEQKGVLAIKADTTKKNSPATLALKNLYNEPGVPVSMLFAPGKEKPVRWHGMFFADELKELLEKLPSKHRAPSVSEGQK